MAKFEIRVENWPTTPAGVSYLELSDEELERLLKLMRENPEAYDEVLEDKEPEIYEKIWDACAEATNDHEKWHTIDSNLTDLVNWDWGKVPKYLKAEFGNKVKSIWDLNSEDRYDFVEEYGNFIWYGCDEIEFKMPDEIIKLAFPKDNNEEERDDFSS